MDDALEADNREQTTAHCGAGDQAQNDHSEQASSIGAAQLLQEGAFLCSGHVGRRVIERDVLSLAMPRHGAPRELC